MSAFKRDNILTKNHLVQPICDILQKLAWEISPIQPEVITNFQTTYLGISHCGYLSALSSGLRGFTSTETETSSDDIPEDIMEKAAKFREGVMATKSREVSIVIFRAILKSVLFRTMDRLQLQEVICVMKEQKVKSGDIVLKGGETSNKMYIIEHGIYRSWPMRPTLEQIAFANLYKREDHFSEMGLIYDVTNDMSVQAVTDGILWYISRDQFNRILLGCSKAEIENNRLLLSNAPILQKLSSYEIDELNDYVFLREYDKGAFLYCQGDIPNGVYIIESGSVGISVLGARGNQIDISTVPKGGIVGESSLISREPRMLSAYAQEPTKVLFLNLECIELVVGPCLNVMQDDI